ncbi:trypsin-like serine protease [Streptomyces sp. RKAG293]|uniref:trypsin-like serine protease n=1 Tax=Streptomyces sp. RKAG293 TaxID=2893403 RepID=UPI00203335EB|nr:trypsin-like serine protease [Streptomyces sp. RKAG293]MCM2423908.1 trypsin-like serine protease [Streptomyces sp. RKAG293]
MFEKHPRTARISGLLAAAVAVGLLTGAPTAQGVVGDSAADNTYAFTAKLDIGGTRACTGALVDAQWILTASSCFADDPRAGFAIPAGAPKLKTLATIGRTDLSGTTGTVVAVTELVPRVDRDLVMAKLASPVVGVSPVALGLSALVPGEVLRTAGYGRTQQEWVPNRLHSTQVIVDSVAATSVALAGRTTGQATVCQGDTGGPVFREHDGRVEVAAVNSRAWQGGCLGSEETRTGAVSSRVDDIDPWIEQVLALPRQTQVTSGDFDGDKKADVAVLNDYGKTPDGRNRAALWVWSGDGLRTARAVWDSGTDSWNFGAGKLTSGDYNGDGKTDVGVLYNYGATGDGRSRTALFTFLSNGTGFGAPTKVWDSGADSWNWNSSLVTSGDYNADGKADIGVLYNYGATGDGRSHTALWTFTSTGAGVQAPRVMWDSAADSWNWSNSKLTSGDYNGDGKTDIGVLYNYGKSTDGRNQTGLWTFSSNGDSFQAPRKLWDNGADSWNWNSSLVTSGDYNADGKADIGVLYDNGATGDGRSHTALWTFTSTGTGIQAPRKLWDSAADSWNWNNSKLTSGDYNGDGKTDIGVLYNYGTSTEGRTQTGLWNFPSTGTAFQNPSKTWDNREN